MKLLLDTHILLWTQFEPARLVARIARELNNPINSVWLSPVTIWELLVLEERNRIQLNDGASSWITQTSQVVLLQDAPLTREVAMEVGSLRHLHRDPVDRFLVATARVYDLTLVTADERLMNCKLCEVLPNR